MLRSKLEPPYSCDAKIKKMHFKITKNAKYAKKEFFTDNGQNYANNFLLLNIDRSSYDIKLFSLPILVKAFEIMKALIPKTRGAIIYCMVRNVDNQIIL